MSSNYVTDADRWNHLEEEFPPEEQPCSRCRGTGSDRDGADCVYCEGWGSVLLRY